MVDVGAGDGSFVVRTAAGDPGALAVAVDANAEGLYEGFRRARKAKLSNALFVVAAAESLPGALAGSATEVRVQFPWGSLLTALLGGDRHIIEGIAAMLQADGGLTVLTSVVERDGVEGLARLDDTTGDAVARRIASACDDLELISSRAVAAADVVRSHSTWAKRLRVGTSRPGWLFEYRKRGETRGATL